MTDRTRPERCGGSGLDSETANRRSATRILQRSWEYGPRKTFALFSGGNDSSVLVHWAQPYIDAAVNGEGTEPASSTPDGEARCRTCGDKGYVDRFIEGRALPIADCSSVPEADQEERVQPHCPFCSYEGPNPILREYEGIYLIEPLNPVCEGHVLVIPIHHVTDFTEDAMLTCKVASAAASYAQEQGGDYNLITSKGPAATQTVPHLHFHLIPRSDGDGLALPWTDQDRAPSPLPEAGETRAEIQKWRLDDDGGGDGGLSLFPVPDRVDSPDPPSEGDLVVEATALDLAIQERDEARAELAALREAVDQDAKDWMRDLRKEAARANTAEADLKEARAELDRTYERAEEAIALGKKLGATSERAQDQRDRALDLLDRAEADLSKLKAGIEEIATKPNWTDDDGIVHQIDFRAMARALLESTSPTEEERS